MHMKSIRVFSGNLLYSNKKILTNVYEFKKMLPRAFYIKNVETILDKDLQIEFLKNNLKDPSILSFINKKTKDFSYDPNAIVEITFWSPDKIKIKTQTTSMQLLMLSEIFYPKGWKITSHPQLNIERINYMFRGIFIPPGNNEIVMEFIPNDIYYGKLITFSSTILIVCLIFIGLYLDKRKNDF